MEGIKIKWLGHSCFKLTFGGWTAVVDPYADGSVEGLGNVREEASRVFCSHSHHDHNARELVKIVPARGGPEVKMVKTFHDNAGGAQRGENFVTVFEYRGMRLGHFGDLGHTLTRRQLREIGPLDLALLPVGGFFTVDAPTAKEIAGQLKVKTVIPMHYRGEGFGFGVLGEAEAFTDLFDRVTWANSCETTLDKNTPEGALVLTPALLEK